MYNAYKFVTPCRAPAPIPCPARRRPHRARLPSAPAGPRSALLRAAPRSRLPSSAAQVKAADPTVPEDKNNGDARRREKGRGGEAFSPRSPGTAPRRSQPVPAGPRALRARTPPPRRLRRTRGETGPGRGLTPTRRGASRRGEAARPGPRGPASFSPPYPLLLLLLFNFYLFFFFLTSAAISQPNTDSAPGAPPPSCLASL